MPKSVARRMANGLTGPDKLRLFDHLCARLATGMSLRKVCKEPGMPCAESVYGWMRQDAALRAQYMVAKREAADALAEEILDIADDGRNDWMASEAPDNPGWRANGEYVQRSRLRVETRKWLAAKLMPKVYGEALPGLTSTQVMVSVITGVPEPQKAGAPLTPST